MRRRLGQLAAFPALACLLLSAAPAPVSAGQISTLQVSMVQILGAQYAAWTPPDADTTPLALLRALEFDWDTASAQLAPLFDDAHAYAELRGVSPLADGGVSIGVLRAALYRKNAQESVLVLNDDWCAAGLCRAHTRFVLLRPGQPDTPLSETKVVPRILDSDLLGAAPPACLKGVTLGVQYLPSRYDTTLTAMATVPPQVRLDCEQAGSELALVARPLRLNWNAAARKFVRAW